MDRTLVIAGLVGAGFAVAASVLLERLGPAPYWLRFAVLFAGILLIGSWAALRRNRARASR